MSSHVTTKTSNNSLHQNIILAALKGEEKARAELRAPPAWAPPSTLAGSCPWFLWTIPAESIPRVASNNGTSTAAKSRSDTDIIRRLNYGQQSDEARELLAAGECCVLSGTSLWPASTNFARAEYLRSELKDVPCRVLGNTAHKRDFTYFRVASDDENRDGVGDPGVGSAPKLALSDSEWKRPATTTVHMRIHDFLRHRGLEETDEIPLLAPAGVAARDACLYLQQELLLPAESSGGSGEVRMEPLPGLGPQMMRDIAGLNVSRLQELARTGGFGPWRTSQLFVGTSATAGARSTLHFDHNDNLFLQISGSKRFRIFEPLDAGNIYAYPVHHPLDRRAQVDLSGANGGWPRLAGAREREVTVGPGDVLFLPAYWWHEVYTLPVPPGELVVSINFWFGKAPSHLPLPLPGSYQLELVRQLEQLAATALGSPRHLPAFMRAACAQMRAVEEAASASEVACWAVLDQLRPLGVDAKTWSGLYEYAASYAVLLLGPARALSFLDDLCDPARFECLRHRGV